MRSSRISKDASKLFDRVKESNSPPRRVTRSALAKFAFASTEETKPTVGDIEDIGGPVRKRKRVTAVKTEVATSSQAVKSEPVDEALDAIPSPPAKARRVRKPARKATDATTGTIKIEPPSDWEEIYDTVRKMRAPGGRAHGAAVDTMGCERLADKNASPKDQRFHTLVALMLSSQTKDTVNAVVMRKLQTELPPFEPGAPPGLNLNNVLAIDPKILNEFIWAVGFHNNKTKYIKQTAEILRDQWDGDIPDTIEGLVSLPGVGPKMGYLCLSVAWGKHLGIGVDVHVHRITNLWGWHKTKNPEETRTTLQSWLPQDRWHEINHLLVGLGQSVCLPVGRKCGECDLGLEGLCKAADRAKVSAGRKIKAEGLELEAQNGAVVKTEVSQDIVKEEGDIA
ncbi:alpha,alpha-trehalase nth1 [Fusarium irregulare]|uniref:Endonuclease III homolog n=1 Tax=Fusarium irregulare TaxID=2494466 RepID=A0A9W8PYS6_9HYPO|nr:alpha,alpha-trehalase nth1 [Fusarium irregulare]KAJ4028184.1 alpha,alpha-trehalase nth1 [Fusarium irregulare]